MKSMMDIDREIAEYIMGYKYFIQTNGITGYTLEGLIDGRKGIYEEEWCPSTNISQAFKVAEQLKKSGLQMHLFSLINDTRVVFYKSFRDWHELKEHDYSVSDSPAMAICLAALKIMEEV